MYIVVVCSLVALFLTYLESIGQLKKGMLWGIVLVTLLQVIHYDYGNDYMAYHDLYFEFIRQDFDWNKIFDKVVYREPGWVVLNYIFKPFGDYGFFVMVALISIFQGVVMYKSIRRFVPRSQWPFAMLIYLFATSFYLMSFSMLRQSLVMMVFVSLWPLIQQRKFVIPLIVLYLCSFIHGSSIILLPFAFWGFIPMGKYVGKVFTVVYLALFLILFIFQDYLNQIFTYAMALSEDLESYQLNYEEGNRITSFGLGFFLNLIPLYIALRYIADSKNDKQHRLLVALSSISFIILPFGQIIQMIGRIGLYFSVFSIMTIPMTYAQLKNDVLRWGLISMHVVLLCYSYWGFFQSPVWSDAFGGEFNTIFSVMF